MNHEHNLFPNNLESDDDGGDNDDKADKIRYSYSSYHKNTSYHILLLEPNNRLVPM